MTQQKSAQPRKNAELDAPVTTRSLHATKAHTIERSRTRVNDAPSNTTGAALALTQVGSITMSSREIASVTRKRHDNVAADIRNMLEELGFDVLKFQGIYLDSRNRQQIEYHLTRELTDTLLTGYSAKLRLAVVRRWHELEQQGPAIPKTMAQALRLAAEQAERLEHQQAALSVAAPKVEFVDRFVSADGLKGFREVCKLLKANEAQFREFVFAQRIMYRLGGTLTAYQPHIDAGRFDVKAGVADNEHAYTVTKFTPKGVAWIAELWAQGRQRLEKMGVK